MQMLRLTGLVVGGSLIAACATGSAVYEDEEWVMSSEDADHPAQLLECPGYVELPDVGSVRLAMTVVVAEDGSVRYASAARPSGTRRGRDLSNQGVDAWHQVRADAQRLAEGCRFNPARHEGIPVATRTTVQFRFLEDPTIGLTRDGMLPCPPRQSTGSSPTKTQPSRCIR